MVARTTQRVLVVTGSVMVAAGLVLAALLLTGVFDLPWRGSPPFTQKTAEQLAADLRSGDREQVTNAIAMPDGVSVPDSAVDALRQLPELVFDPATFINHGDGVAEVHARAGDAQVWAVYLLAEDGAWRVTGSVAP